MRRGEEGIFGIRILNTPINLQKPNKLKQKKI